VNIRALSSYMHVSRAAIWICHVVGKDHLFSISANCRARLSPITFTAPRTRVGQTIARIHQFSPEHLRLRRVPIYSLKVGPGSWDRWNTTLLLAGGLWRPGYLSGRAILAGFLKRKYQCFLFWAFLRGHNSVKRFSHREDQ